MTLIFKCLPLPFLPSCLPYKKSLFFLFWFLSFGFLISPAVAEQYADSEWAKVKRYLAVHPGVSEPVWENANQSLVTNGAMEMTPVGDGTYRAVLQLVPGASYNFMFFAKTTGGPPPGLSANTTYFDAVPTGGNIQSGTQPLKVTIYDSLTTAPVRYSGIGTNNDARRRLDVPANISAGDTLYIYGNFADRPRSISNFDAQPIDTTSVRLTWGAPYGAWGQNGESFKAPDVIAGGKFKIYRNTTANTTVYSQIAQVAGTATSFHDSGLTANTVYYYVITAADAYTGTKEDSPFWKLESDTTYQDSATPRAPVRIRFKVHHLDWDYVEKHGCVVYMTSATEEDIFFAQRIYGVIARVKL